MIELLALVLLVYFWDWMKSKRPAPAPKDPTWRAIFKKRTTPPVEVTAPTYALAVRALMKRGIDYKELKKIEAI